MTTLNHAILDQINAGTLTLDRGCHDNPDEGHCAMEVVSLLANAGFTDAPGCASRVIRRMTITLNDRWSNEKRQQLIPYLTRMVGTNDGRDEERVQIARRFMVERTLEPWLRAAGLNKEADSLPGLLNLPDADLGEALWAIRRAAADARSESRKIIEAKVREHLKGKPAAADADAVAAAAADAAAVAVADAAADAVAVAVADAAAVADAVAAAAAAADADADAAAAAAAAAVAVAAAAAAADAVAVAAAAAAAAAAADAPWGSSYDAAHKAARDYYQANPDILAPVTEIAAQQDGVALELLEQLIRVGEAERNA